MGVVISEMRVVGVEVVCVTEGREEETSCGSTEGTKGGMSL